MATVTYHHVMLSTDGSDHARRASDHAIAIAKAFHARLTVLGVVDIYAFLNAQSPNYSVDLLEEERTFLQKSVDEAAQAATAAGITSIDSKVVEGSPHTSIADAIRESGVDLVVVGSHGRNVIERLLLGSTSEYLVRHSPCPVLVIRPEE